MNINIDGMARSYIGNNINNNKDFSCYREMAYVITNQSNHILSAFHDPLCNYQMGDRETNVYLWNNKDLVVNNLGDVSSLVIIKDYKN